jgi:RHS repeat-associated protein
MTVRNGANTVLSTDSYTYSPNLDYLTGATYTGTPTISGGSWTYDASGNRSNSGYSYDALNRMTASPGTTYSHDIVGNRLQSVTPAGMSTVTSTYEWDALNRLTNLVRADSMIVDATDAAYTYRADGLRTSKIVDYTGALEEPNSGFYDFNYFVNNATTNYFYDGQMAVQERYTADAGSNAVNIDETRNFLGARGIDMIEAERIAGAAGDDKIGSKRKQYPIYDGHGNMICSLIRSTAGNGYSLVNEKRYDAWGAVVQTSGAGDALANPKEGYQGAIGHKYDAESDLIYMRARFYEPSSGRFVSQDTAMDGHNWFIYCTNDPIQRIDFSGNSDEEYYELGYKLFVVGRSMMTMGVGQLILGIRNLVIGAVSGSAAFMTGNFLMAGVFAGLMLWGSSGVINGLGHLTGGYKISQAGKYLSALGEDGLEYAMAFLTDGQWESRSAGNGLADRLGFGL